LINHSDKLAGQTALFYASRKGHTEMCRKLIEKGANSTHLDSQNKTAADYAKKARNNETADYLSQEIKRQREPILQSVEVSVSKEDSQA
jgi:ankyrin repeat protein